MYATKLLICCKRPLNIAVTRERVCVVNLVTHGELYYNHCNYFYVMYIFLKESTIITGIYWINN